MSLLCRLFFRWNLKNPEKEDKDFRPWNMDGEPPEKQSKIKTRSYAIIYAIITPVTSSCKTALPATSCGWPALLQTTEASAFSNNSTPTIHWIPTTFVRKLEDVLLFPNYCFRSCWSKPATLIIPLWFQFSPYYHNKQIEGCCGNNRELKQTRFRRKRERHLKM